MKALVPVLALAVLAAGCLSADPIDTASLDAAWEAPGIEGVFHTAGGILAPPSGEVARAVGAAFHTGLSASEPTLAITSDGTIFFTANAPNPSCGVSPVGCPAVPYAGMSKGATLARSKDNGLTWEDVYVKLPTGDNLKLRTWDPMVIVDKDTDRVFMDDIFPLGCGWTSWSDDGGDSWSHDPASCGNPQVNDHQTIGTGKPRVLPTVGYPNLVYRCVNNPPLTACAISVNGGQTFSPQIPVAPGSGCGGITGHLEADSEGRMFLPMNCPGDQVGIAMTEDDGRTWSILTVNDERGVHGLHVDIAIDEADNLYALWPSDGLPWFASSTDHGATWSEPVMVGAPGVTMTKFNAIAAGAPGKVAFAYVGTTIPGAPDLPAAECGALPALPCTDPEEWAEATWNAYLGVVVDALAPEIVVQTVTANDPADPLARGACADRCHGMTDFLDVQVGPDGRAWGSFVDVCVAECVTDPSVLFDGNLGLAATLQRGPALRGEAATLAEIPLQVTG